MLPSMVGNVILPSMMTNSASHIIGSFDDSFKGIEKSLWMFFIDKIKTLYTLCTVQNSVRDEGKTS